MELRFSDGWSASSSFIDGGVRFKFIRYDPANWDFIELPASVELKARQWFEQHEGAKYSLAGQFRFFLGFVRPNPHAWYCSDACVAALGFADSFRFAPNISYAVLSKMKKV
jgi:hypothetical protein